MSHCAKIVFLQNLGDVKNEVFEKKIAFFVFSFFMLEKEKQKKEKMEKAKKPYKTLFCVRKGEKTRIFVHTICFGQTFFGPKQNQETL